MGAVIFLHFFPRVFVILVLGVGWVPHGQSDFQIQALEGAPVLTNGLDQRLPFLSRSKATPLTHLSVCVTLSLEAGALVTPILQMGTLRET